MGDAGIKSAIQGSNVFFFFNDTATTEIYTTHNTLSLHDALPISAVPMTVILSDSFVILLPVQIPPDCMKVAPAKIGRAHV